MFVPYQSQSLMSDYIISGTWKNESGAITHYTVQSIAPSGLTSTSIKISKPDLIELLLHPDNSAQTLLWDYKDSKWKITENIHVVKGMGEKYLRTNPDESATNNLSHLIDYSFPFK